MNACYMHHRHTDQININHTSIVMSTSDQVKNKLQQKEVGDVCRKIFLKVLPPYSRRQGDTLRGVLPETSCKDKVYF
jgi:hypothetical protein